jgi:superfamily I DNA/RNA helicase
MMKTTSIYGPPGTGKTTWMMNKVSELLTEGFETSDIMYLSFTKAATGEVLRRMGVSRSDTVSTIHSACYRLLELGGASVVNFYKLKAFGQKIGMPFKGNSDDAHETMEIGDIYVALHQLARNRMRDLHEEYMESDRQGSWDEFSFFCESYDSWKDSNGLIDFTDMLEQYAEDPRPHGCKVVFIDESQDLSPLQWEVINGFVDQPSVQRIYFAGDDDQAIYEWAGANPRGMVEFEEQRGADRIVLDRSYRIPAAVHRVVSAISDRIVDRVPKIYAPRPEEGLVLRDEIYDPEIQKEGFVLCRTHSIKQKAEKELIRARVPFHSDGGGLPGPFSCKATKAIRAWRRYKDTNKLPKTDLEAMIAAAIDRVRGDLVAGDTKSVLKEDPMKIFRMPMMFIDYFRDVDIFANPRIVTSTIHASKGREAPEVTLITDWTGRVEAGMVINPDSEHRVWYVAASRAKNILRTASLGEFGYDL